jgi:putative ABC transport system ATP-binding protein
MSILSVTDLKCHHRSASHTIKAVDGVSFSIEEGEFIAIVGPSGSGKSTLLSLLAGLEKPDEGTITLVDVEIQNIAEDDKALFRRQNIGFIFQTFQLFPHFTALENVQFPLEMLDSSNEECRNEALQLLGQVGLSDRVEHYPNQLSGGEQQRVAVARAFAIKPKILLADEPTGNLDTETGERVMQAFFNLQKQYKTTVVMVTHDNELAKRADRILRMHKGKLFFDT